MTSIPADRGILLGNVVEKWRIDNLQVIAELQSPVDLANDRLNNLVLSNHKIGMIYLQMVNMKVDLVSLEKLNVEKVALKAEMADAAIDLGLQTVKAERAIRVVKEKMAQMKISKQIESPIDFELSKVAPFPLSFDSLNFDVQYFKVMESLDASTAHASQVSSYVASSFSVSFLGAGVAGATQHAQTASNTAMAQASTNKVEGTIVIVAEATHKQTDMIVPCYLDAQKSVKAWNYTYPEDPLTTDPMSMILTARKENPLKTISVITGEAKSSSFVGYVHLLKTERTEQTQMTDSVVSAFASAMEVNMMIAAFSGKMSMSQSQSSSASQLFSTAKIQNTVSLTCQGVIPSIVSKTLETSVQNLQPDPSAVMTQLAAISQASGDVVNNTTSSNSEGDASGTIAASAGSATQAAKAIELNNSYITSAVQALGEATVEQNQVIDTNSMMTAFEDFVKKVQEGNCGVPTKFLLKELTKADIAKVYIRKYYPNGAQTMQAARDGELGINREEKEGG